LTLVRFFTEKEIFTMKRNYLPKVSALPIRRLVLLFVFALVVLASLAIPSVAFAAPGVPQPPAGFHCPLGQIEAYTPENGWGCQPEGQG
jgi:hypothetical protein